MSEKYSGQRKCDGCCRNTPIGQGSHLIDIWKIGGKYVGWFCFDCWGKKCDEIERKNCLIAEDFRHEVVLVFPCDMKNDNE